MSDPRFVEPMKAYVWCLVGTVPSLIIGCASAPIGERIVTTTNVDRLKNDVINASDLNDDDKRLFQSGLQMSLPKVARDRALAALKRFSLMTHSQFRMKKTYAGNIFEAKLTVPQGGLRLLFVYGKTALWCIGAFLSEAKRTEIRR